MKFIFSTLRQPNNILLWGILSVCGVYIFSIIASIDTIRLITQGLLPLKTSLYFFVMMPKTIILNSSSLVASIFFFNTILLSFYITLFLAITSTKKKSLGGVVLSSSWLSVVSLGCAGCGSLLTPLLIGIGLGIPLTFFSYTNVILAFSGTLLLIASITLLIKKTNRISCAL
jgi:hypothetical protein